MKRILRTAAAIVTACLCAWPADESRALVEGRGAGGEPYATGGVGEEERELLTQRRAEFSVWITTAAKQSGAYLADVRVKVTDAANRQILETVLDGPLMLIRLAPGQYAIEASVEHQRQQRAVAVGAQGRREIYFYFDVAADTVESATKGDAPMPKRLSPRPSRHHRKEREISVGLRKTRGYRDAV